MIDDTAKVTVFNDRLKQIKRITIIIGNETRYGIFFNEMIPSFETVQFTGFYTSEYEAENAVLNRVIDAEYTERELAE